MDKQTFLTELLVGLSGFPQDEVEERLNFYSEMIDDRMEDGLTEEEAVAAIGPVDEIIAQTLRDVPLSRLVKEKIKGKRRFKPWETTLLILGSPIWFSLLLAAFAVIFSLYVSLWAVVVSLWAVFISLTGSAVGILIAGIFFVFGRYSLTGAAMIGVGLVGSGLSVFLFFGCKAATKGIWCLAKKILLWIKNQFTKKEDA